LKRWFESQEARAKKHEILDKFPLAERKLKKGCKSFKHREKSFEAAFFA